MHYKERYPYGIRKIKVFVVRLTIKHINRLRVKSAEFHSAVGMYNYYTVPEV